MILGHEEQVRDTQPVGALDGRHAGATADAGVLQIKRVPARRAGEQPETVADRRGLWHGLGVRDQRSAEQGEEQGEGGTHRVKSSIPMAALNP